MSLSRNLRGLAWVLLILGSTVSCVRPPDGPNPWQSATAKRRREQEEAARKRREAEAAQRKRREEEQERRRRRQRQEDEARRH